jgi:hypothetical protein
MIELLKEPWPWYVCGVLIGLIVPLLLKSGNKYFGIWSSLRQVCATRFRGQVEASIFNGDEDDYKNIF